MTILVIDPAKMSEDMIKKAYKDVVAYGTFQDAKQYILDNGSKIDLIVTELTDRDRRSLDTNDIAYTIRSQDDKYIPVVLNTSISNPSMLNRVTNYANSSVKGFHPVDAIIKKQKYNGNVLEDTIGELLDKPMKHFASPHFTFYPGDIKSTVRVNDIYHHPTDLNNFAYNRKFKAARNW